MKVQSYNINKLSPQVIIWGGTTQAKLVRPIIEYYGSKIVAIFDDTPGLNSPFPDVEIYCGYDKFIEWIKTRNRKEISFCIAIGNPHGRARLSFHERLINEGLSPITIAHPAACIAEDAVIGDGSQILAGAIISAEARLGRQCIINSNAYIGCENVLADGVEVGPGATLCGIVHADVNAWICAGATVIPRVKIGPDAIVGAGAVVIQDVPEGVTVVGVPARGINQY